MSLLMEALRKAEEAKRRMQQEEQGAAGHETREPADPPSSSQSFGSSAFTLEDRDDLTPDYIRDNFTRPQNRATVIPQEEPPARVEPEIPEPDFKPVPEPVKANASRLQQRSAAASVFAAKQSPARNRNTLTILVIVMVLLVPLVAGGLWYLQSASSTMVIDASLANYDLASRSLSDTPPRAATRDVTAPPSTAAAGPQAADVEPAPPSEVAVVEAEAPAPQAESVADTENTDEGAPQTAAAATPALSDEAAETPAAGSASEAPAPTLDISRTRATRQVNPDLVAAYESLQTGDLATAGRLYRQLLDVLPNNRDALLGLALVNQRQGNPVVAREMYARLLQLNPRDALAHTGLLQTMQVTDAAEHENTLKNLMAQYPDVAQLTLALGNLYASQQRWSEAQGAYYNALLAASRGIGPVHPDYAFNLAVSLERLGEPQAALEYYRQAQALARETTPGFDLQRLNGRLDYLSTQAQP